MFAMLFNRIHTDDHAVEGDKFRVVHIFIKLRSFGVLRELDIFNDNITDSISNRINFT